MVLRTNKIMLGAIIFTACLVQNVTPMEWRERSTENMDIEDSREETDKMKCISPFTALCKVNKELPESLVNYFAKRKSLFVNGPVNPHRCSCQMVNKIMHLGRSYYPRILENRVCKNDSCGFRHRCVERKYSVRVLKLKDYMDTDTEPMCFAANSKDVWVPETLSVGVACECVPII